MKATTAAFDSGVEPAPEFMVAILYDDETDAVRAVKMCDRLIQRFNDEFLFSIRLFSVRSIDMEAGSQNKARASSQAASLVLIAAREPLGDTAWFWLEDWAAQMKERPAAIAALHEDTWCDEDRDTLLAFCSLHAVHRIRKELPADNGEDRGHGDGTRLPV